MSLIPIVHRTVVTAVGQETVRAAAKRMAENNVGTVVVVDAGTRRLVVTGEENRITGILCLDDVLGLLAGQIDSIGRILAAQGSYVGREVALAMAP